VHAVAFWFQLDMDGAGNVLDTSPANTRCLASACLPTRVPANSRACQLAFLPSRVPANSRACQLACLPTRVPANSRACQLASHAPARALLAGRISAL